MSILKVSIDSLEGNTIKAAAMEVFNLKCQSEAEIEIVGSCDIVIVNGVAYDWWVESDSFCFLEA